MDIAVKMTDIKLNKDGEAPKFAKIGCIIVNNESFNVTMSSDSSKVFVSKKLGIIDSFRNKNSRNKISRTLTAIALERKIAELVKSKEYAILKNTLSGFRQIIHDNRNNDKPIEIANYGFSRNRRLIDESQMVDRLNDALQDKKIHFNKIDDYNDYSSLRTTDLKIHPPKNEPSYFETMANIASNKLQLIQNESISKEQLQKWTAFLARPENYNKINIPLKIYNFLNPNDSGPANTGINVKKTGWQAAFKADKNKALRSFIIKNFPTEFHASKDLIDKLANKLEEFANLANIYKKEGNSDNYKTAEQRFLKFQDWAKSTDNHNEVCKTDDFMIFQLIITTATFRQTSKLGLSFFKERQVPVMFQFSDRERNTLAGTSFENITNNKFWQSGDYDGQHIFSRITESELRHVKRILEQEKNNININTINSNKLIIKYPDCGPKLENMIQV